MSVDLNDERLTDVLSWSQSCAALSIDMAQRLIILVANVLLIVMAVVAFWADRGNSCDEPLHLYGGFCVFLLVLDTFWELIRCNKESNLDRLQSYSWASCQGTSNLLSCSDSVGQVRLDGGVESARRPELSAANPRQLVGQEKSSVQRRLLHLQRWSVFFTCFVAVLFSFFSDHDVDCSMNSPNLYNYVRNFSYVFIFRVGINLITYCCRTIKDYEDAALNLEAMYPERGETKLGPEMRRF